MKVNMSKSKYQGQTTNPPADQNTTGETTQDTGATQENTTTLPPEDTQSTVTTQSPETTQAPEVTQPPVTTQAPEVTKAPVSQEAKEEELSVFANRLLWIGEHGTVHEKHVVAVLNNYVAVGLSSVNLNDIAVEQQRFWRLFEYIHNQPAEFQKLYSLVIEFGKEYKDTLFNLSTLFRAQSGLNLSADQLSAFNNLRTLLLNTIQTKDLTKVKKLVDIRKIVEHDSIPEHIRGMYVSFYS